MFLVLAVFGQDRETRSLSSFNEITASEGIDVRIRSGSKEEAIVEADNIELGDVETRVSGGVLDIYLSGRGHRNVDVTVWVTYKTLIAVGVSSAADMRSEERVMASGDFEVRVSSAGELDMEVDCDELNVGVSSAGEARIDVNADHVDASASSAGDIELSGTTSSLEVDVSSSGDFDGFDLSSEQADVSASSGGSAEVRVNEELDARASSGGSIEYEGSPRMDISTSSGGSVRRN